jgi:hypothetical protein
LSQINNAHASRSDQRHYLVLLDDPSDPHACGRLLTAHNPELWNCSSDTMRRPHRIGERMTYWQRWILNPQTLWLRKAIFQVHLWMGIGLGMYVLMISVTGSIVEYRNELYAAATPDPIVLIPSGPRLTDDQLKAAVLRAYPGRIILNLTNAPTRLFA